MPAANALKALWLAYLSQPAEDRVLFRAVRKTKPRRIVEIGLGDGLRALRLITLAQRYHPASEIRYTGLDLFEGREANVDGPVVSLSLKQAYRRLRATKSRVNLAPGELEHAIARVANVLTDNDLLVFSSDAPEEALTRVWYFVPRMLKPQATVFFRSRTSEQAAWRQLGMKQLQSLADESFRHRLMPAAA